MATKATKEIAHALEWLAAEFKFLKQLDQDLQKIDQEPLEEKEKDLQKDKRVIRYIGKSERRLESDIKDIIKQLEKDKEVNIKTGKLKTIITELTVPANELISKGSLYVGDLKKRLKKMRTDAAIAKKYPSKPHQDLIHTELENLDSEVRTLIRWITGLDAALKKAATFFEEEVQTGIIREINGILADHLEKLRAMTTLASNYKGQRYHFGDPEFALFRDWPAESLKKRNDLPQDLIDFIKNVHQGLGLIFIKHNNFERWNSEMRILREKLKIILNERSNEFSREDREKVADIYKNLIWVLDIKLREQVPINKLIETIIKILKKKKISCSYLSQEMINKDFLEKIFAVPFHGLVPSKKEPAAVLNNLINILKDGFATRIQAEGAINLSIVTDTRRWYLNENFRYFNPFGFFFKKEVNEILTSPIVPQEIMDELEKMRSFFGLTEVRNNIPKILTEKVIALLKKHGFGTEFDQNWALALTNADTFRRILKAKWRGKMKDAIRELYNPKYSLDEAKYLDIGLDYDIMMGFRAWYIDQNKKLQSLKITPEMIERVIVGDRLVPLAYGYEYLKTEYQQLLHRIEEEKLLVPL